MVAAIGGTLTNMAANEVEAVRIAMAVISHPCSSGTDRCPCNPAMQERAEPQAFSDNRRYDSTKTGMIDKETLPATKRPFPMDSKSSESHLALVSSEWD